MIFSDRGVYPALIASVLHAFAIDGAIINNHLTPHAECRDEQRTDRQYQRRQL